MSNNVMFVQTFWIILFGILSETHNKIKKCISL